MPIEYKCTVAVLFKNGASVTTKTIMNRQQLDESWSNAVIEESMWRIEVGDEKENVLFIDTDEIAFVSIMKYIEEQQAARQSGIAVPQRAPLIVPHR